MLNFPRLLPALGALLIISTACFGVSALPAAPATGIPAATAMPAPTPAPPSPAVELPADFNPYLVAQAGCEPYAPPGEYLLDHTIYRGDDGVYHLFAIHQPLGKEWWSGPYQATLHHAVSRDLCTWEPRGEILPAGDGHVNDDVWDGRHIWAPHIVRRDGTYYLFYTGVRYHWKQQPDGKSLPAPVQAMGLATSPDLVNWTKHSTQPIFQPTHPDVRYDPAAGDADARDPMVFHDQARNRYILYYTAIDTTGHGIVGAAVSTDLLSWQDQGPVLRMSKPILTDGGPWMPESSFVLHEDGRYHLFFTIKYGPNPADHSMRLAVSADPLQGWQLVDPADAPRRLFSDQRPVAIIGEPIGGSDERRISLITAASPPDHDARRGSGLVVDRLVLGDWPRQVGAVFFYWFDCTLNPETATGRNCDPRRFAFHPPGTSDTIPAILEPRNPEWYRREVQDMVYAGINIVFPVSMGDPPVSEDRPPHGPRWPKEPEFPWGDPPGYYSKQSWLLSDDGLVGAIRDLNAPLKVGILDDMTSQLDEYNDEADDGLVNGTNYCSVEADLEGGRPRQIKLIDGEWVPCDPIQPLSIPSETAYRLTYDRKLKPYFEQLPRDLWATHNGRPVAEGGRPMILVFPPAGGDPQVVNWTLPRDEAIRVFWDGVKQRFAADFGVEPFILLEGTNYNVPGQEKDPAKTSADAMWYWNPVHGSHSGFRDYVVNVIGPGENSEKINSWGQYNPAGRNTIQRGDRTIHGAEDLRLRHTFENAWRADLLLVVTWNELLEGHGIMRAIDYPANEAGEKLKPSFYLESLRRLLGRSLDREAPRVTALDARVTGDTIEVTARAEDSGAGVERIEIFLAPRDSTDGAPRASWQSLGVLSRDGGDLSVPRASLGDRPPGDYWVIAEANDVPDNWCRVESVQNPGCGRVVPLSLP